MNFVTDQERRQAQLRLLEPEQIEASLRNALNAGGLEYASAIGMIRGTSHTLGSSDTERLVHIDRILDVLERITLEVYEQS